MAETEAWRPVALAAHWSAHGHGYTMVITEAITGKVMTLEMLVARYNVLAADKLTAAWEAKTAADIVADKAAGPERWPAAVSPERAP